VDKKRGKRQNLPDEGPARGGLIGVGVRKKTKLHLRVKLPGLFGISTYPPIRYKDVEAPAQAHPDLPPAEPPMADDYEGHGAEVDNLLLAIQEVIRLHVTSGFMCETTSFSAWQLMYAVGVLARLQERQSDGECAKGVLFFNFVLEIVSTVTSETIQTLPDKVRSQAREMWVEPDGLHVIDCEPDLGVVIGADGKKIPGMKKGFQDCTVCRAKIGICGHVVQGSAEEKLNGADEPVVLRDAAGVEGAEKKTAEKLQRIKRLFKKLDVIVLSIDSDKETSVALRQRMKERLLKLLAPLLNPGIVEVVIPWTEMPQKMIDEGDWPRVDVKLRFRVKLRFAGDDMCMKKLFYGGHTGSSTHIHHEVCIQNSRGALRLVHTSSDRVVLVSWCT